MNISFVLNGKRVRCDIVPDTSLFELLRSQGCMSVKCGCETSDCGLCTVWVDGVPTLSCSVIAARVDGHDVTTLEGLQRESHAFAECMAEEGAEQCGFCSPGLIMTVLAFERELAGRVPTEDEVRRYLAGNLCRCTGYMSQMRAIRRYLGMPREAAAALDASIEKEGVA
ncbi:(2Fe-2S)-binding protein [Enorma phocaeensis]|uniref:2Fe-2S iron-sulfur cluster-binding protein n=1 Tax=Enorma phocaeensis TaxID=1871019 RepID=A0ABT7VAA2_9ACTN|nr:2Fe-2S iron-sulfur cluster-binding protein [Enorma phocaeensis]MDM8275436.1 2Fe-2S iron-sulfur cluster-binding protein [Enorma phocaeensis]